MQSYADVALCDMASQRARRASRVDSRVGLAKKAASAKLGHYFGPSRATQGIMPRREFSCCTQGLWRKSCNIHYMCITACLTRRNNLRFKSLQGILQKVSDEPYITLSSCSSDLDPRATDIDTDTALTHMF